MNVNLTRPVSIKLLEALGDDVFPELVHLANSRWEQLVVRDLAVTIQIKFIEECSAFLLRDLNSEVTKSLPELLDVQSATIVVVHYLEDALNTEDTPCTSLVKFTSKHLDQLVIGVLDTCVACTWLSFARLRPLHLWIVSVRTSKMATTSHWNFAAVIGLRINAVLRCLPFTLTSLIKRSFRIRSKQISMMVRSVSVPRINLRNFAGRASKSLSTPCSLIETPGIWHHQLEVGVRLDATRHVGTVVHKLIGQDSIISVSIVKGLVMLSESGLKLLLYDWFTALAWLDIWMLASAVCSLNLLYCHEAVTLHIQKFEDSHRNVRSKLVEGTHYNWDELGLTDLWIAISIEGSEQTLHISLIKL